MLSWLTDITRFEGATRGYFAHGRGYPVELAKLLPSIVVRNKTYIDVELDRAWRDEYMAKGSKDKELKWLEARVAERRIISDVSLFFAVVLASSC